MKATILATLFFTSLSLATPAKRQDEPGLVCPDTGLYYYEESCIEACVDPDTGEKGSCASFNGSEILFECTCP